MPRLPASAAAKPAEPAGPVERAHLVVGSLVEPVEIAVTEHQSEVERAQREAEFLRHAVAELGKLAPEALKGGTKPQPAQVKQIAPDLYFFWNDSSSNAMFLVGDDGVMVVDTQQHPADARRAGSARPG